jgi:hypothetical protein
MIIMKTKITLKSLVFPILSSIKYSEFKTPKKRKYLLQNMIILIQKMTLNDSFFISKAILTKIDLTPMKVVQLIKSIQPSITHNTLRSNFYNCILLHFLTI